MSQWRPPRPGDSRPSEPLRLDPHMHTLWVVAEQQDPHRHDDVEGEARLLAALSLLDPVELEAIRLVVLERESYRKAGAELGVGKTTVQRRVQAGLARMRHHLTVGVLPAGEPPSWEELL